MSAVETYVFGGEESVSETFDVRNDLPHLPDRLLGSHIKVGIIRKYDDSIDGNVVVEDEPAQGFDMTGILPDRIPQLVLLGDAVTFIAPVR